MTEPSSSSIDPPSNLPNDANQETTRTNPVVSLPKTETADGLHATASFTHSFHAGSGETSFQVSAAVQPDPLAPTRLPEGYEWLRELGRGGMGVVYKARDLKLDRIVALKMILHGPYASHETRQRFLQEAKEIARLKDPHIVQIYELGEYAGMPYFTMEFCELGTLKEQIGGQPQAVAVAVGWLQQIAQGVAHAHSQRILHRDLKPGNILIGSDGLLKVADFGLAKRLEEGKEQGTTQGAQGTPSYMAPEQIREGKKQLSAATDVYALGAILYAALTGRPPFLGASTADTWNLACTADAVSPRQLNPKVPRDLETICLKCLHKDPARRYASAAAFVEDLRRVQAGQPILARPVSALERASKWVKRNQFLTGSLLAVFLILAAAAIISYVNLQKAKDEAKRADEEKTRASIEADLRIKTEIDAADARVRAANDLTASSEASLRESRRLLDLSRLREANTAFENNQVQIACDILQEIAPENRCVVWGILNRRFEGSLFTLYGHTHRVSSVAMSADGSRILSASVDNTVRLWDARTGRSLLELGGHEGGLSCATLSADGTRIVAGSFDGTAKVWDVRNGEVLLVLKGHRGRINQVVISNDGARIVTASLDKTVRVWDGRSGQMLVELNGNMAIVQSVALTLDGSRVVTGLGDESVKVWDSATGRSLLEFKDKGRQRSVLQVAINADGSRIVTGAGDRNARVWNGKTGQLLFELKGHTDMVLGAAWSADDSRIVTASVDNTVKVWDARTAQLLLDLKGHLGRVNGVAISADGARIVTGSDDATVKVWEARTGQSFLEFKGHGQPVTTVAISTDNARLVTGSEDKTARVWDARTGQSLLELKGLWGYVVLSADGSRIVTPMNDKSARVWAAGTGQTILELPRQIGYINRLALSADGARIVTFCVDQTVKVWDAWTGAALLELKEKMRLVTCLAISADGNRIATGLAGLGLTTGSAKIWDAKSGQLIVDLKGHTAMVKSAALSADGSWAVTGSDDRTAKVWDARTGQEILELKGHARAVTSVALSADERRICTGSDDQTVRFWDAKTGQLLLELKGSPELGSVKSVALSADSSRLIIGSADRTARLWEAKLGQEIVELKGHKLFVEVMVVSADGRRLITGSDDQTARLWDTKTGQMLLELKGRTKVACVAISDDNARLVTGDATVKVWDAKTGEMLFDLKGHKSRITSVAINSDGSRILSGSHDNTVHVWDGKTGALLHHLKGHTAEVTTLAISADGKRIVSGSFDKTARVWDGSSGQFLFDLKGHYSQVARVVIHADVIETYDYARTRYLWDAATGRSLPKEGLSNQPSSEQMTPDGKFLFLYSGNRVLRVAINCDEAERIRRISLSRPDPIWHAVRASQLSTEGNLYGGKLQSCCEQRARGLLSLEAGDHSKAYAHFIAAALLTPATPRPPVIPELLPKPRIVRP